MLFNVGGFLVLNMAKMDWKEGVKSQIKYAVDSYTCIDEQLYR